MSGTTVLMEKWPVLGRREQAASWQVIANNTAPPVPYEPILVPNPEAEGTGFLLLAVPRSQQAPHAVTATPTKASKDVLRYPRRGGSQTDWLTETMVATAYRARYTAAAAREERLTDVESDIVLSVVERTTPHLIVALVPQMPGEMVINASTARVTSCRRSPLRRGPMAVSQTA